MLIDHNMDMASEKPHLFTFPVVCNFSNGLFGMMDLTPGPSLPLVQYHLDSSFINVELTLAF